MDIVLRAIVGFCFVLFVTRVVGRRELSSLQPFDLILLVMIGDLVQQGITQNDFSVTGLVLAAGTIAVLTVVVSYSSFKFPRLRPIVEGEPVIVVEDGRPIVDRATGEVHMGQVPPYAVVVPGALPGKPLPDGTPGPSLYCAVIVKTVDAQTRAKTGINELLRD